MNVSINSSIHVVFVVVVTLFFKASSGPKATVGGINHLGSIFKMLVVA